MISLINFVPSLFLAQETSFESLYSSTGQVSPMVWVIDIVIAVVMIASMWKVFAKAGQPGWAAIVPIYNLIVLCQVAGRPIWWFLLLLICFPIFYIIVCIDIAKRFGKGVGFALGMIFLGIIFWPILGFGSAQYQGGAPAVPV
jgi:hypothetical protein